MHARHDATPSHDHMPSENKHHEESFLAMDSSLSRERDKLSVRPEFPGNRLSYMPTDTPLTGKPNMTDSPLTRQVAPEVFEPKVVELYKKLFRVSTTKRMSTYSAKTCQEVEDDEKPQGFWTELFLLKPDIAQLRHILESTDGEYLIHLQVCTDQFGCLSIC